MTKRIFLLSILSLFLVQCGNEESDFPGSGNIGTNSSPPVEYKTFTPIFYKAPYTAEMLYHVMRLASFNKFDSSFFVFFDTDSPSYKSKMQDFLKNKPDSMNIIALGVVPKDILMIEQFQSSISKAIFIFPTEKPAFTASTSSSSDTGSSSSTSIQIFPANYNYMSNALKIRYSLQDMTFLATALKALTGGNINVPPLANVSEIAYIQGETRPQSSIHVEQGSSADSMRDKTNTKALDDGTVTGIPIDPSEHTKITLSYDKQQSIYWIGDMNSSFLFFLFPFISNKEIHIASYFTPLKLENLSFASNFLELQEDQKKKALYAIHITIDNSADSNAKSFTGDYRNGELFLKMPPSFIPISYRNKNMTINATGGESIKLFSEVKETKKDYSARSTSGGTLTLHITEHPQASSPPLISGEKEESYGDSSSHSE